MTKDDILLVIQAFFKVNRRVRLSHDAHSAFKYASTDEYLEEILEQYNKLKEEKDDKV